MTPEALRILEVFRSRGVRAGQTIHPADFSDAIVWKDGFVRDEQVRNALSFLFDEGYLIELNNAFELTVAGEQVAYGGRSAPEFGARVYRIDSQIVIKQTVLRGVPAEYVIDEQRVRHLHTEDDAAIAAAVRDAVDGRL